MHPKGLPDTERDGRGGWKGRKARLGQGGEGGEGGNGRFAARCHNMTLSQFSALHKWVRAVFWTIHSNYICVPSYSLVSYL